MEIFHHFGIKILRESDAWAFVDLGIRLQRGPKSLPGASIASFEISEDDPRWSEAQGLAEKLKITNFGRTAFSESELASANALCILASAHRGYPEPSERMGYREATYDLSEYCSECGIGLRQIRPFRIKSNPASRRSFLQLNWIFDEFFVSRDVWASVFKPFGVDCWPVLSDKTGDVITSIVQLRISYQAGLNHELNHDKMGIGTNCPRCGRTKTPLSLRGFAPAPLNIPSPLFRSTQYFGTGANAFNRVFVSAPLYRAIQVDKLRGVEYYPCDPLTTSC